MRNKELQSQLKAKDEIIDDLMRCLRATKLKVGLNLHETYFDDIEKTLARVKEMKWKLK